MNKALALLQTRIGKDASLSPSPLMRWLNPTLLTVEEGTITLKYLVREEMTNPLGNLHGGTAAAIVDDAIGATIYAYGEDFFYSTVNLVVDYFWTVKSGEEIIVVTHVIKKGRQLINAQCELWTSDKSRMIAKGYSNLLKTEIKK